jgi:hypothetical protein
MRDGCRRPSHGAQFRPLLRSEDSVHFQQHVGTPRILLSSERLQFLDQSMCCRVNLSPHEDRVQLSIEPQDSFV